MISRALVTLIKFNHLTKLTKTQKTRLLAVSQPPTIKHFPGTLQFSKKQTTVMDIDKEASDPKRHLDYNEVINRKDRKNVVLIDVREDSEIRETGKIPGSIHIPMRELKRALADISEQEFEKKYDVPKPSKDAQLIFSCHSGSRSRKALKLALELGFKNASHYKGGWTDWAEKTKSH